MSRASLLLFTVALVACNGGGGSTTHMHPLAPTAIPDAMHGPSTPGDIDGDGVPDAMDDCPSVANADQRDACNYDAPAPGPTMNPSADAVAYLSFIRAQTGLGPVSEDTSLSHGCAAHLAYLVALSAEVGSPQLGHTEDLSKSYASAEGNDAGINSVLAIGNSTIEGAIDVWINSLYHRLPLLHPGLQRIGVAQSGTYGCIQYRPGTDGSVVAPHPIFWPPPDIQYTDQQFGGNEGPCPTVADPLAGGACPAGGAIATVSLNGLGDLSAVSGTMRNVDDGSDVSLFRTYYDGGPSLHEQEGYIGGSVALIPQPGSSLGRGTYEVTIDATVGGTPSTYRWRFRTAPALPTMVACDAAHGDVATAAPVDTGETPGKICTGPTVFLVGGSGSRQVTLDYDYASGDLDMEQIDMAGTRLQVSESTSNAERLSVPAGSWVRIYGYHSAMGAYVLRVQ